MDRQGFEQSRVTAGLPTPQHTAGISGTDPTLGSAGMTNSDTGLGTTGISPTGNTAGTVTDSGLAGSHLTESRQVEVTGVHVPVVPIEGGDAAAGSTGVRHGTQAHKEHKAEKQLAEGRI